MNIIVVDTETTSLDKPFCYNVGYVIANADTLEVYVEKDFVVEQVWHNLPLFSTAYYASKRPLYVADMRAKRTTLKKWGYIMQEMKRDIAKYNVEIAYAYNSPFDDKVFAYNCDWFKTVNPIETLPFYDIRAYAIKAYVDNDYKAWCDTNECYTDSGNYSTTAETMYRYLFDDTFEEAHTALADSRIELEILLGAKGEGIDITIEEKPPRSIERIVTKTLTVKKGSTEVFSDTFKKISISKDKQTITIR